MTTIKNGHDKYVMVRAPNEYPGRRYHNGLYCYEHHLNYWNLHGIVPGPKEVIHHKDGNKRNNADGNLELISRVAHSIAHAAERRAILLSLPMPHGTINAYKRGCRCSNCRAENAKQCREYRWRVGIRTKGRPRGSPGHSSNWEKE